MPIDWHIHLYSKIELLTCVAIGHGDLGETGVAADGILHLQIPFPTLDPNASDQQPYIPTIPTMSHNDKTIQPTRDSTNTNTRQPTNDTTTQQTHDPTTTRTEQQSTFTKNQKWLLIIIVSTAATFSGAASNIYFPVTIRFSESKKFPDALTLLRIGTTNYRQ
jgi:hypothetical protein